MSCDTGSLVIAASTSCCASSFCKRVRCAAPGTTRKIRRPSVIHALQAVGDRLHARRRLRHARRNQIGEHVACDVGAVGSPPMPISGSSSTVASGSSRCAHLGGRQKELLGRRPEAQCLLGLVRALARRVPRCLPARIRRRRVVHPQARLRGKVVEQRGESAGMQVGCEKLDARKEDAVLEGVADRVPLQAFDADLDGVRLDGAPHLRGHEAGEGRPPAPGARPSPRAAPVSAGYRDRRRGYARCDRPRARSGAATARDSGRCRRLRPGC